MNRIDRPQEVLSSVYTHVYCKAEKKEEEEEENQMGRSSTEEKIVYFTLEEGEKPLYLRIQRPEAEDKIYRISRYMALRTMLLDYCNRLGLFYEEFRFTYDGTRLREDKTGDQLGMGDDDVIDAWSAYLGGAAAAATEE
ncbi:unnamed protein product [Camellia sinensis]